MAKEVCGGDCSQMDVIKVLKQDGKDGVNDGKVSDVDLSGLSEDSLEGIGVVGKTQSTISKIKTALSEAKNAASSDSVGNTFIGKIKSGMVRWQSKVSSKLPAGVDLESSISMRYKPRDMYNARLRLTGESRFSGRYFAARDRMSTSYNAVKDPDNDLYIPTIDENLLGDKYDEKLDPCSESYDPDNNPSTVDYDASKNPCLAAKKIKE